MPTISNTPMAYFFDSKDLNSPCLKDAKEMEKKCAPDNENENRAKGRPAKRGKGKHESVRDINKEGNWMLDHCGPVMSMPGDDFKNFLEQFSDVGAVMDKLSSDIQDKVITKLRNEALEYGAKAVGKMALRRGLTGWIPVVGWIMTVVDVASTVADVAKRADEVKKIVNDLEKTVKALKEQGAKITETFSKHEDKLKNYGNLSKKDQESLAREIMVDVQSSYAAANPCLRARKCMLVPYDKGLDDKLAGNGCCPGQTGHHILPDAMFRDPTKAKADQEAWEAKGKTGSVPRTHQSKKECWSEYSEGAAPTICAEGTNQYAGSHGVLHTHTTNKLAASGYAKKTDMPYEDARDLILTEIATLYGCEKKCLVSQLDAYYCDKAATNGAGCPPCNKRKVTPHSGVAPEKEKTEKPKKKTNRLPTSNQS